jgi:YVTN family beta-propeller protein
MKRTALGLFSLQSIVAVVAFALVWLAAPLKVHALNAPITNSGDNTVSVIDTTTNTVIATVPVGRDPRGVAVTPDGTKVYVTNFDDNTVSVIGTVTNTVFATIPVGEQPTGLAVTPDGSRVYVANSNTTASPWTLSVIDTATKAVSAVPLPPPAGQSQGVAVTPDGKRVYVAGGAATVAVINTATNAGSAVSIPSATGLLNGVAITPDGRWVYVADGLNNGVSVINTTSNSLSTTIPGFSDPFEVAVSPNGSKVYVTNFALGNPGFVSVIDTDMNTIVVPSIPVGSAPAGLAVTPDGNRIYVANLVSNDVSVIDTGSNAVIATIPVGNNPEAYGLFIQPVPVFARAPGARNCHGTSVSALARKYRGLEAAADALGVPSVSALQEAIRAFCDG